MGPAVRRKQPIHQRLQSISLANDDLGVFTELRLRHFKLKQLRRTTYATQRVLDFMGQVTYQLLVGLRLFSQAFFTILARLLLQRQQFNDDLMRLGQGHDHVHQQRLPCHPQQPRVIAQGGKLVAACTLQRRHQMRRLGKTLRKM